MANIPLYLNPKTLPSRGNSEGELEWFSGQTSLKDAIVLAALARNKQGKRFSHQCRIPSAVLRKAKSALLLEAENLGRCKDFDSLFDLVEKTVRHIDGIGELYIYDTALRIGANLKLLPQKVYLHRGTRKGAKILGLNYKARFLEVDALPQEFRHLPPHEIEDALCRRYKRKPK